MTDNVALGTITVHGQRKAGQNDAYLSATFSKNISLKKIESDKYIDVENRLPTELKCWRNMSTAN